MLQHLPAVLVLTDRRAAESIGRSLGGVVAELDGMRDVAVVFREKDLSAPDREILAREVAEAASAAGLPLLVASDAQLAVDVGADGVHLAADDDDLESDRLTVGRSCHGLREIHRAESVGVAYVTVGPVFESRSKPGYGPAIGVQTLAGFAAATALPVYALAGVEPGRALPCAEAGAYGVAVMRAVMGAEEPRTVAEALLGEVHRGWVKREAEGR